MSRRLHTELIARISEDLAGERVMGLFSEEQDQDNLSHTVGPTDMTVAAGAAAQQIDFPPGTTVLRFIAVMHVDSVEGVNLHFGAIGADPVLVAPPLGGSLEGQMVLTTNADSLFISNPSVASQVRLSMMLGFGVA